MKVYSIFCFFLFAHALNAQTASVQIAVSRDTILKGNAFYLQYTFDAKEGQFIAPKIIDGEIISQSLSSNTSIINGEIKAQHKQRFLIEPKKTGEFIIPSTIIRSGSSEQGDIEIPMIKIVVKENPNQTSMDPEDDSDWQFIDLLHGKPSKRKSKKL